jgi:glycosyltransferase involved in cell wall biosynthesis
MNEYIPKVSIVTPSYNQGQFLEQTIQSVLSQDYPNIEYIIIDGGSTDESREIIERYADQIDYWVSEPDKGQSDAINKGFRKATGEIIAWLNSDDVYLPGAVSTAVEQFRKNRELTLFYGDCVFIGERGEFLRYFDECEEYNRFRLLNCSDFIMQPTTFFRRAAAEAVGFLDESLHWAMDWDLWCKLVVSGGQVHFEPTLIAANRDYGETKTNVGGGRRIVEIHRVVKRHRTSLYPHAILSYWLGMLKARMHPMLPDALIEYDVYPALFTWPLQLLTPSNFWQGLAHARQVQGLQANRSKGFHMVGARGSIIFPRPPGLAAIEVDLELGDFDGITEVTVAVNGVDAACVKRYARQRLRVVIPAKALAPQRRLVDISLMLDGPSARKAFAVKHLFNRQDHLLDVKKITCKYDDA